MFERSDLPACSMSGIGGMDGQGCRPSVFVMGRNPIDRAISYYYQRCFQLESCIGKRNKFNITTYPWSGQVIVLSDTKET